MQMFSPEIDGTWKTHLPLTAFSNFQLLSSFVNDELTDKNTPLPKATVYLTPELGEIELRQGELQWRGVIKEPVLLGFESGNALAIKRINEQSEIEISWTVLTSNSAHLIKIMRGFYLEKQLETNPAQSKNTAFNDLLLRCNDWLADGDVGLSSLAIYRNLVEIPAGLKTEPKTDHPHDPSDLFRCLKLLRIAPELDDTKMSTVSSQWKALVDIWPELESTFSKEKAKGNKMPETYALMQSALYPKTSKKSSPMK